MDFELSDDQRLLKDSVDRLLTEQYGFSQRKGHLAAQVGWSREMWRRYAEMGLLALPFAESDGGIGGGPVEMLIVMEGLGRALVVEPYFATVVLGGGFLRHGGTNAQRSALAPRIASGELLLTFAQAEKQSRYDLADVATRAERKGGGWRLNGQKRHVVHGDCADMFVATARVAGKRRDRDGIALFLVDANAKGVSRRSYVTQDNLRAAEVTFDNVVIDRDAVVGEAGAAMPIIDEVVDCAIAALCAEAVGAMDKTLELTLEYLKVRNQFGQPIGAFQALQHRAVDMLIMTEQARCMALYAAMMSGEGHALERRKAISAAKVQIGRASKFVGEQAIQLHGGVGLTDEYQVGHFFRRLTMIGMMFGDASHHLSELSRAGGLAEPGAEAPVAVEKRLAFSDR